MTRESSEMKTQRNRDYRMENWREIQLKDKRQYLRTNLKKHRPTCPDLCLCVFRNKDTLFLLVKGRPLQNGDFMGFEVRDSFMAYLKKEVEMTSLLLLFPQLPKALLQGTMFLTPGLSYALKQIFFSKSEIVLLITH